MVEDILRECYERTPLTRMHWMNMVKTSPMTQCLTDYLNFCVDVVVPTKRISLYK